MQRVFWISFCAAASVYLIMVLWSLPLITEAAQGLTPFDMRPLGYSAQDARAFLGALSDEGRQFYVDVQQKLDILYPALLGLTLILGFQILFARPWSSVLGVIALLGAAADYLENYLVAVMLTTPVTALEDNLVGLASFWTLSKSLSATVCFVALIYGFIRLLVRRRKGG